MKKIWDETIIEREIKKVVADFGLKKRMPCANWLREKGHNSLCVAISKHGGFEYWANKIGLVQDSNETINGKKWEQYFCNESENRGWDWQRMKTLFPYDVLINKVIKVDVKSSHKYIGKRGEFYSFGLGCLNRKGDFIVAYCLSDKGDIIKTYIIPSIKLEGIRQLSLGVGKSKYDKYIDRYDLIQKYIDFFESVGAL